MAHRILSAQNDEQHTLLLMASSAAYRNAKRGAIFITFFIMLLSYAYPITYVFIKDETTKLILFGFSFVLNIAIQILTGFLKDNTSKGALFKEEFDVTLFGLPWKTTLKKPEHTDVIRYARRYTGAPPADWYSVRLSEKLPDEIAVAAFQHTNTSWDIDLRKKYMHRLIAYMLFYTAALAALLAVRQADFLTVFFTLFSVFMFYSHFITLIRGHSSAIKRRESISAMLDEIIFARKNADVNGLRDIQDEIYYTRQESAKVPDFFFRFYKERLSKAAEAFIERVNGTYREK